MFLPTSKASNHHAIELLDATKLTKGAHYKLCTDQDGPGPKPEGNSGSLVCPTSAGPHHEKT